MREKNVDTEISRIEPLPVDVQLARLAHDDVSATSRSSEVVTPKPASSAELGLATIPRPGQLVSVERAKVKLGKVPSAAGGLGAMISTAKHLQRDSGLLRGGKALLAMNQPKGFDCPGCAWPEPAAEHRARFEFCENGAKAIAEEATTAKLTPELFAKTSIDELRKLSDFELGQLGRITHPMILDGRHYKPIEWEAAYDLIAGELRKAGPEGSVFYTSGR